MSPRRFLLLAAAGAVAVTTFLALRGMSPGPEAPPPSAKAEPPPRRVLVATADLPAGRILRAEDVAWKAWPEDGGAAYFVEGVRGTEAVAGAVIRRGIRTGEPLTEGRLAKPGDQGFLAAVLEPGLRAVSVPVNGVTGISGFVFPGDRVDVILTHVVPGFERKASETVLSDVRVLAIDQRTNDQTVAPNVGRTATLEVTPRQAERLRLVNELGQLSLSLRSTEPIQETAASKPPVALAPSAPPPTPGPLAASAGSSGRASRKPYTLDSDVSGVVPRPDDAVMVFRGANATRAVFDRSR